MSPELLLPLTLVLADTTDDDPGNGALILTAIIIGVLALALVLAIALIRRRASRDD